MSPELLLKHFDQISNAPDAVPRLRRFILDLAVRGKLVEQHPEDEPAAELMKRIEVEKARRVAHKNDNPKRTGTGVALEVPPNWEIVPLIALGSWAIGSGFPKSEQGCQEGPYFFLKVSDMNLPGNEKYIVYSQNFIDEVTAARIRVKIHPSGTIIFPKIGGAIATNKRRILTRGSAIDNNCLGITFWQELPIEWCYLLLTTLDFAQYQAGTAVPALQQSVLEKIPIWLPPLAEQHRIVAKVGELMALCDELEVAQTKRERRRDRLVAATLRGMNNGETDLEAKEKFSFEESARFYFNHLPRLTTRPEYIQQLRQTILNLAVRGKLVPQDPKDEPADALLKRIREEKQRLLSKGGAKKERAILPIKNENAPFQAPPGWEWVRLGELTALITKGSSPKWQGVDYVSRDIGILFITSENVGNYRLRKMDESKYVEKKFNEIESRSILSFGDILMNLVGASIGRTALYDLYDVANINQAVALIRLVSNGANLNKNFLLHYLNSSMAIDLMLSSRVVTAQPNISLTDVREFPIPLPPLAEQHRIVAKVDELMTLCAELEDKLSTTTKTHRQLIEATLREAINVLGELKQVVCQ